MVPSLLQNLWLTSKPWSSSQQDDDSRTITAPAPKQLDLIGILATRVRIIKHTTNNYTIALIVRSLNLPPSASNFAKQQKKDEKGMTKIELLDIHVGYAGTIHVPHITHTCQLLQIQIIH